MSIKNKWAVMECPACKNRMYYYLDQNCPEGVDKFEEAGYDPNDLLCYKCCIKRIEIPYEEWNTEDISEILGNELEDRNHHSLTSMPRKLLDTLRKTVPENLHADVMKSFMEEFTKDWR